MSDKVELFINGEVFEGWKSVAIKKSIKNMCGTFSLTFSDRWTGKNTPMRILPQDAAVVKIDGTPIITGFVDSLHAAFSDTSRELSVEGRCKTSDLVDGSGFIAPGNFSASLSFLDFAKKLCAPFGINVVLGTTAKIKLNRRWVVERTESVAEALEKAAKLLGLLLITDNLGNLVIASSGSVRATGSIEEAQNILTAEATLDFRDRFSKYTALTQVTNELDPTAAATPQGLKAVSLDAVVKRFRPLNVMADGATTYALAKKRADWEMRTRAARSSCINASVVGWRDAANALWAVNTLVSFNSKWLGVNDDLLISETSFSYSESTGKTTQMLLERKDAYLPEPIVPKDPTMNFNATPASEDEEGVPEE